MYAIVKDNKIEKTGTLKQLFPTTSFAGGIANEDFKTAEGLKDVVNGERKDPVYYYVTQGDITLVDGVPTQQFTNTAKRLEDEDAKDKDGNQVYVQVWDEDTKKMVDTSEKRVNQGLKSVMNSQVKDTTNKLLSTTDWMIIRKVERSVNVPSATETYRNAVLAECGRLESAISAVSDVDALAAVMAAQNWPKEG